jgi:hypothetical protein
MFLEGAGAVYASGIWRDYTLNILHLVPVIIPKGHITPPLAVCNMPFGDYDGNKVAYVIPPDSTCLLGLGLCGTRENRSGHVLALDKAYCFLSSTLHPDTG